MTIEDVIKSVQPMDIPTRTVINMMYTSRYMEEKAASVLKEHDLTIQQYNVLRILRGQRGVPTNLSTIQERMVDKNSNTTRLVDKLITKGYVNRQVCEQNRRKVEIFITEEGSALLKTLDPITLKGNEELIANLSETELETLNNLLDKLRNDE